MNAFLKVLVLVIGGMVVMTVAGCGVYRKVDVSPPMHSQPLVSGDKEIRAYVEPHKFNVCTGGLIFKGFCASGEMSGYIIPALAANNIRMGSKDDHNVAIKTSAIKFKNASLGLKVTTEFLINGYTVVIETETYSPLFEKMTIQEFDAQNAFTVTGKILSKLIRNNIGGNFKIKAKVLQKNGKIVEWNDSTGL